MNHNKYNRFGILKNKQYNHALVVVFSGFESNEGAMAQLY